METTNRRVPTGLQLLDMPRRIRRHVISLLIALSCCLLATAQNSLEQRRRDILVAYADSLSARALIGYESGDYKEAIRLESTALRLREESIGKDNTDYVLSLIFLASYYQQAENYPMVIKLGTEALEIGRRALGTDHPLYLMTLSSLASCLYETKKPDKALPLLTEYVDLQKRAKGTDSNDYILALFLLSDCHYQAGNYAEAIKYGTELVETRRRKLGEKHPEYIEALMALSHYYLVAEDYQEAIRINTRISEIKKKTTGTNDYEYASSLISISTLYYLADDPQKAIQIETEALDIIKRVKGDKSPEYLSSIQSLASSYYAMGDYPKALRVALESKEIAEESFAEDSEERVSALRILGNVYRTLGNCDEAIRIETEVMSILERTQGKESEDYVRALSNVASNYFGLNNYQEAIRVGTETIGIIKRTHGKESQEYAMALAKVGTYHYKAGNYQVATLLVKEAASILERATGRQRMLYATALSTLSRCYSATGNHQEAIRLGTEATDILRQTNKNNLLRTVMESYMATIYDNAGDTQSLAKSAAETTSSFVDIVRKAFTDLTAYERNMYWQQFSPWFTEDLHVFAYKHQTDALIANAYDGALMSKGLLLNSEIEMSKLLLESGDKEAMSAYAELQRARQRLNKLYEQSATERQTETQTLEKSIDDMERSLIERSKTYGDYTRNLSINWKDVLRRLGKRDVAVEFVSFPCGTDSTMYAAYILTPDMKTPRMVTLFEARQLSAIPRSTLYTTPESGRLVWGKLREYLDKADNVYFSPAGELYNIAIETLTDWEDTAPRMHDRWHFYRLSSTRELALVKNKNAIKKAALYGGLRYDTGTEQMEADSRKYSSSMRSADIDDMAGTISIRGGVAYLPATKTEAEHIEQSLKRTRVRPELYSGDNGTEASFKNLSGQNTNLLHLATHGFYWTEREARMKDNLSFLMTGENKAARYTEDKALTRSGLMFAGANNALTGKELPKNVEDGILTAKEISTLDLRGLDLVVMSACQTGLGEVTGDGVFGLQRGFKKAGANSILMSLWSVPDTPTRLLMTRFYDNLLFNKNPKTGKAFTKQEALIDAQRHVREYEDDETGTRPYEDPTCWAAFILLDAID